MRAFRALPCFLFLVSCGDSQADVSDTSASSETGSASIGSTGSTEDGTAGSSGSGAEGTETGGVKYDVGPGGTDGGDSAGQPSCKIVDGMDAIGDCTDKAPPNSFEPEVQWTWTVPEAWGAAITPLVANLTDDNGDGEIDLCDVPDVVAVVRGNIYVLDGLTGALHFQIADEFGSGTPALGDIDGDGLVEIVAMRRIQPNGGFNDFHLAAYEHDGTPKWTAAEAWGSETNNVVGARAASLALADMDNDGDVEIAAAEFVADHLGNTIFKAPFDLAESWFAVHGGYPLLATAMADLDGDGDQELVVGHAAYHHDGTELFLNAEAEPGYPQIANLDDDPEPEILLMNDNGITILEHDGTIKLEDQRPTGDDKGIYAWGRPAAVHDFDGDGVSDFAVSSRNRYAVYERDATLAWMATVNDSSGLAAGTAFDFLGDGVAEAMYADQTTMFVFDGGSGDVLLQVPRSSGTQIEYPVVADVDNDGSAEIVVVSNKSLGVRSPTLQVIRDVKDRWIQARRIWNQHTYHVTNVREDGTIPQFEEPSWKKLNTYRTQAQIQNGGVCKPPPPG